MACARCGGDNPPGAAFCGECGIQLTNSVGLTTEIHPQSSGFSGAGGSAQGIARTPGGIPAAGSDGGFAEAPTTTIGPGPSGPPGAAPATTAPPAEPVRQDAGLDPGPGAGSEPTRYLCAAAQMDGQFAGLLVDGILRQEHRSVAASPDVDLVTVLKHAIAGNTRRALRDTALFVLFALMIALLVTIHSFVAVLVCYLLAVVVVTGEELHTRHEVLAGTLSRSTFRPAEAPDPPAQLAQALRRVAAQRTGNVTVYSGYVPFIGYGKVLDSWSFALDITTPSDNGTELRGFTAEEIHDHVARQIALLALPSLELDDRLFVNGLDIRSDARFLPDPTDCPVAAVGEPLVRELMMSPEDRARPYLTTRVVAWRGELALSVFCRFVVIGSYLFAESSYSLLTPMRDGYHLVDRLLPTPTPGEVLGLAARSPWRTIKLLGASPPKVFGALFAPLTEQNHRAKQRREIERNPFFDYGSLFSVREAASDGNYHRYFQKLDSELFRKVIERRILDAMVEFLDDHGISTGDLVERQTTILNNGVLVTGHGTLNAGSVAAGTKASARSGSDSAS